MSPIWRKTSGILLVSVIAGMVPATLFGQGLLDRLREAARAARPQPNPAPPDQAGRQGNPPPNAPAEPSQAAPVSPPSAPTQGKYDVVGVRTGMPIREAMLAIRAHDRTLQAKPDSAAYDVLPNAMTYGISAMGATEKIYLLITMPPNMESVSTIGRYVNFTKENAPTQQVVVEDLKKKYGEISWDTGAANLSASGLRSIGFVDDLQGRRLATGQLRAAHVRTGASDGMACETHRAFGLGSNFMEYLGNTPPGMDPRIEKGFDDTYRYWPAGCWDLSMVQVYLFSTRAQPVLNRPGFSVFPWGSVQLPDIVGSMMVVMASGPLDRSATEATRNYLLAAIRARDDKAKEDATRNRPKL